MSAIAIFYRSGWSAPHVENITVRVSRSERAVVRLPLPERRAYDIVLRIDPVTPTSPEEVDVLFNRHLVGRLRLAWNPERVGSYRLRLREDIVTAGSNELIVIPSSVMPAGSAGPGSRGSTPPTASACACGTCASCRRALLDSLRDQLLGREVRHVAREL